MGSLEEQSRYFNLSSPSMERGMALFALAGSLRRRAAELLETGDTNEALKALREAAGVYEYMETTALPEVVPLLASERPAELLPSMARALCQCTLGDAQAVAVRRAEEKGTGFPLIAALHRGTSCLFAKSARTLDNNMSDFNYLSQHVLDYLFLAEHIHAAQCRRTLSAEAMMRDEAGIAIAHGQSAEAELTTAKKRTGERGAWAHVHSEESRLITRQLKQQRTQNEAALFRPVPTEAPALPEPKIIVTPVAFALAG